MEQSHDNKLTRKRKGTLAGILVALAVILIFILVATFLKSLIFGIILAFFFLPLEKFFENHFFQWKIIRKICSFVDYILMPLQILKKKIAREKELTEQEKLQQQKNRLLLQASIASLISVMAGFLLILFLMVSLLIPSAVLAGKKLNDWANSSQIITQAENIILRWTQPEKAPERSQSELKELPAKTEYKTVPQKNSSLKEFFAQLKLKLQEYIQKNHKDMAKLIFSKSTDIISNLIAAATALGVFAFDLLLCLFFFFFFLQQMAKFSLDHQGDQKDTPGEWCVRGIFNSSWMPDIAEQARDEAVEIINRIALMFKSWIRGYLWIIIIETVLYLTAFSLFRVPYAVLLACGAGLTILLPFLGPVASFVLTITVCGIVCPNEQLLGTLIGVCISYALINGILEQLFLYPSFVGGAIGLTTLETIIVVLLGGLIAGIAGMIFAVPAAAIIKYLIPKIYQVMQHVEQQDPEENKNT